MVDTNSRHPDPEDQLDEAVLAYFEAVEAGQTADSAQWLSRYPELADELKEFFADEVKVRGWTRPLLPVAEAARLDAVVSKAETGHESATLPAPSPSLCRYGQDWLI